MSAIDLPSRIEIATDEEIARASTEALLLHHRQIASGLGFPEHLYDSLDSQPGQEARLAEIDFLLQSYRAVEKRLRQALAARGIIPESV